MKLRGEEITCTFFVVLTENDFEVHVVTTILKSNGYVCDDTEFQYGVAISMRGDNTFYGAIKDWKSKLGDNHDLSKNQVYSFDDFLKIQEFIEY